MPETRIVMLYVGEPYCWEAAKYDRSFNQFNHLVLPYIHEVGRYRWPIDDCVIVVIDFGISEPEDVRNLIFVLAKAGAAQVAVRQMFNDEISFYVRQ